VSDTTTGPDFRAVRVLDDGTRVELRVAEGDEVKEGQKLAIIETD